MYLIVSLFTKMVDKMYSKVIFPHPFYFFLLLSLPTFTFFLFVKKIEVEK